ncbi:MAG TPA: hypothetical protein VER38_05185 [Candidatus Eisenbacteria bacterium]|nr:hypothetical protein [Candidatus Eisenbacteria bacterium]
MLAVRFPGPKLRALHIALPMLAALSLIAPSRAGALPLYASREGKTCVSCHYDPNGGGMRNDFGFLYCKNRHGMDTERRWANVTVDPRLNEWVAIGMDTRLLYIASHSQGGPTLSTSTFLPMQGQLNVAITPHDYLTVVMSRGISIDPDAFTAREVYGLIHGLPHDLYAKLGRFRLPFGLRQDDHTSYVRSPFFLPYNSQADDAGLEVGAAGSRYFGQLSFTNGSGTISAERAQTFAGKVGLGGRRLAAGVSGFHQYRELVGTTQDRWGAYAMSTWEKLTLIGEYDGGTQEAPVPVGGVRNLWAAFAELDYRAARGINVRGKIDYLEPDRGASGDLYRRWLVEADFAPVPFTEVKLSFRNHNEEPLGEHREYLVQFFFPF